MRTYLVFIFFCFIACNDKTIKANTAHKKSSIQFSDKYIVCDTCNSVIIVHHEECSFCGELSVDSGSVFIPNQILRVIDTLKDNSDQSDSAFVPHNLLSLHELYFADKNYFHKLWSDTLNFKDFYKVYRLTGKIIEVKHRILDNAVVEAYPSLFFKVDKAEEIDTAYLKKIIHKK